MADTWPPEGPEPDFWLPPMDWAKRHQAIKAGAHQGPHYCPECGHTLHPPKKETPHG